MKNKKSTSANNRECPQNWFNPDLFLAFKVVAVIYIVTVYLFILGIALWK